MVAVDLSPFSRDDPVLHIFMELFPVRTGTLWPEFKNRDRRFLQLHWRGRDQLGYLDGGRHRDCAATDSADLPDPATSGVGFVFWCGQGLGPAVTMIQQAR